MCCSVKMTNSLCSSEVSSYYKQINGITVFYSLPRDAEAAFRKGLNALHVMSEIGQHHIRIVRGRNDATLNATAKEYAPKQHEVSNEKIEIATKEKKKGCTFPRGRFF